MRRQGGMGQVFMSESLGTAKGKMRNTQHRTLHLGVTV